MATYTSGGRFTLQVTGTNNNTWGIVLNAGVFQLVDDSIFGRLAFTLSGTKVLTSVLGATDEARNAILDVTGGTGGTVTIPSTSKIYMGRNASVGDVTFSTGGITNAVLAAGDVMPLFTDGSAVYGLRLAGLGLKDYIAAMVLAATGSLPAVTGNAGKFVYTDGVVSYWKAVATTDIADFTSKVKKRALTYALVF